MSTKVKSGTVIGVFQSAQRANEAVAALRRSGFTDQEIGTVTRNADGTVSKSGVEDDNTTETGAMTGMAVGAAGGAAIGAGIAAGVIPVIGPVLAIGTLGTILLNAAGGAAAIGVAGALAGLGVDSEEANYYESEVGSGRHLVTVAAGDRTTEARRILDQMEGFDRTGWQVQRVNVPSPNLVRTETVVK